MFYMFAAILSAIFMAIVMLNDRLFLSAGEDPVLSNPLQALVISSLIPAGALVMALTGTLPSIPVQFAIAAFIVGTGWAISNAAYFAATKMTTDFDEVSTWDASSPLFMAMAGIPLGLRLIPAYWAGIILVAASLLALRYAFKGRANVETPGRYIALLVIHVGGLTGAMLGFDWLLKHLGSAYYESLYVPYLGGQAVGFLALLFPSLRQSFREDAPKIRRLWWVLLAGEVSYVLSLTMLTWAMKGYPGAVVTALGASYPFLIFVAGPVIRRVKFFRRFGNPQKAFPPIKGSGLKKIIILLGNVVGQALLRPQR